MHGTMGNGQRMYGEGAEDDKDGRHTEDRGGGDKRGTDDGRHTTDNKPNTTYDDAQQTIRVNCLHSEHEDDLLIDKHSSTSLEDSTQRPQPNEERRTQQA